MCIRDSINTKPQKQGFLRKQINSLFDIWNTRYFLLEGTQLFSFNDEDMNDIIEKINLRNCIIDGIWPKDDLFTFTIRYTQNNEKELLYFGAFSKTEAEQWIQNLKNASILAEYEDKIYEIENYDQDQENIKDTELDEQTNLKLEQYNQRSIFQRQVINESEIQHMRKLAIPEDIMEKYLSALKLINESSQKWQIMKLESSLRIFKKQLPNSSTVYKSYLVVDQQYEDIVKIMEDEENEKFWKLYQIEKFVTLKISDEFSAYTELDKFQNNNQEFKIRQNFVRYSWKYNPQKSYFIIKNSIQQRDNKKCKDDKDTILADFDYQAIFVKKLEEDNNQSLLVMITQSSPQKFPMSQVLEKFVIENFINYTVFHWEFDEIIDKVNDNQETYSYDNQLLPNQKIESVQLNGSDSSRTEQDLAIIHEDHHDRFRYLNEEQKHLFQKFNRLQQIQTWTTLPISDFFKQGNINQNLLKRC
eukprot:TRINITY_DN14102_c0_g1_i1.p1 TRINITY_DN14102_c0_g1~~TRINITY_DN14102_c0_g1_i1.p1  ORF type:complete len:473 (-),score=103.64 TRINITY_DN14102_c0_g1_i1:789-2207(-)